MFEWRDLFQWERFITPTVIKIFYALAVTLIGLWALSSLVSGFGALTTSPFAALIAIVGSVVAGLAGVFLVRIATEFVLIVFRINEHVGALRDAREFVPAPEPEQRAFDPDFDERRRFGFN